MPAIFQDRLDGVLRGRGEIEPFLREGVRRRPDPLVRWSRTTTWFSAGPTLVWEYPRQTPEGEQIDILEVMDLAGRQIVLHRIYWGWKGCMKIAPALLRETAS